jgi:hypothetical protein
MLYRAQLFVALSIACMSASATDVSQPAKPGGVDNLHRVSRR